MLIWLFLALMSLCPLGTTSEEEKVCMQIVIGKVKQEGGNSNILGIYTLDQARGLPTYTRLADKTSKQYIKLFSDDLQGVHFMS